MFSVNLTVTTPRGFFNWKAILNIASQIRNLRVTDISADNKHIHTHKSVFFLQIKLILWCQDLGQKHFTSFGLLCVKFLTLIWTKYKRKVTLLQSFNHHTHLFTQYWNIWWIWDSKDSMVIRSWLWLIITRQGGRSWQPFREDKNSHKSFRQARICYFRDKCVVFACNCKFANSIQYNIQYVPCNKALFAEETLFLTQ